MKLSAVEELLVNNPVRGFLQKFVEVPLLFGADGCLEGHIVLEIGCGRGVTTEALIERYSARHVIAFDIDPAQMSRAKSRIGHRFATRIDLLLADAESIPVGTSSVDTVVELAALHHVPRWAECLKEIARVLKPGGRFYFEEPLGSLVNHHLTRSLLRHRDEHGISRGEFERELGRAGLVVSPHLIEPLGILLLGSATKS